MILDNNEIKMLIKAIKTHEKELQNKWDKNRSLNMWESCKRINWKQGDYLHLRHKLIQGSK